MRENDHDLRPDHFDMGDAHDMAMAALRAWQQRSFPKKRDGE